MVLVVPADLIFTHSAVEINKPPRCFEHQQRL